MLKSSKKSWNGQRNLKIFKQILARLKQRREAAHEKKQWRQENKQWNNKQIKVDREKTVETGENSGTQQNQNRQGKNSGDREQNSGTTKKSK